MARHTFSKAEREKQFLNEAVKIARADGIKAVTCQAVANACSVTAPLVFHVYGNRDNLRRVVMSKLPKTLAAKAQAELEAVPVRPARKRSIKEVKAIKDKVAGKRPAAAKKAAAPKAPAPKAAKKPAAPRKRPARAAKKFPTIAAPTIAAPTSVNE